MKKIYTNFKRFDVPVEFGGVNRISDIESWGSEIIKNTLENLPNSEVNYTFFFPEMHLIGAMSENQSEINIGAQGVYRNDISKGGNFGAFTTLRPAAALEAVGVKDVLIGHCEERNNLEEIIELAGGDKNAVNEILNQEIKKAVDRKMNVLYCVGEKAGQEENYQEVLKNQLEVGLKDVDLDYITIAYEPLWAIGPGKTPPDKAYITKIAKYIKSVVDLDVVYGGGLKTDNAKMLSEIEEIAGGLIALTRFEGDIGFYPDEFIEIVKIYLGEE